MRKLSDKEKASVLENLVIAVDTGISGHNVESTVITISVLMNDKAYIVHGKDYINGSEIRPINGMDLIRVLEEDKFENVHTLFDRRFRRR